LPETCLLVFDFDGVICNSFYDSLMTAINTYMEIVPDHSLPMESPLKFSDVVQFEKNNREFCRQFRDLMPFGNFAKDYYVILNIMGKNLFDKIQSQKDFDVFVKTCSQEHIKEYQNLFYKIRYEMQENNPEQWANLLPAFPGIPEAIRQLSQKFMLAIATSKDKRSVNILLKKYGIESYFKKENILDKDFAKSKREHITTFSKMYSIDFSRIYFIDDKLLHLVSVSDLGINLYLAEWGFNTKREHYQAIEYGFELLHSSDLIKLKCSKK